ncbi:MAG: Fe-S cluster assembly protein SufD [Luteibaculaceae bacterium]
MELDTNIAKPIAGILNPEVDNLNFGGSFGEEARKAIQNLSLPTTKEEAWRYTRLTKLKTHSFTTNKVEAMQANVSVPAIYQNIPHIILVNGFYRADLSNLPQSERFSFSVEAADEPQKPVSNLSDFFRTANYAYANQVISITLKQKLVLEQPLAIVNILIGKERLVQPRINIQVEKFAEAKLILATHASQNAAFNLVNTIYSITTEPESHLKIDKVQDAENNFLFEHEAVDQHTNSTFGINTFCLNGAILRNDLHLYVNGENCHTQLYGIFMPNGKELFDNHTLVDHLKPNCQSDENYRGVIMGEGTGVFNGKVFVRKDSQKINAFQENKNVILSPTAQIYAKPELEIYADDVKCSHGSTTGKLDEKALFYLQARGIGKRKANVLLVKAFIHEIMENVYNEFLLSYLEEALENKIQN